jgi:two-component system response regulator AtoC
MLKVAQGELLARLEEARWSAVVGLVHRFGHELATPLSAAALHLEIARRRSARAESAQPAGGAGESLEVAAREIETAGEILGVLAAMVDQAQEPSSLFFPAEVAREALAPVAEYCRGSGRSLDLSAEERGPSVFGRRRQIAAAIETAASVLAGAGESGARFRWRVEAAPGSVRVGLAAEGRRAHGPAAGGPAPGVPVGVRVPRRPVRSQDRSGPDRSRRRPAVRDAMKILIVEDDLATRRGLEQILSDMEMEVVGAGTIEEARSAIGEFDPELCITDLQLPDGDGIEFIREARAANPSRLFLMLTGHGSIDTAVEAMKAGASDYLLKPLKPTQISVVLEKLSEQRELEQEVDDLRTQLARTGTFGQMVGKCASMQEIFQIVSRVAKSDAPVRIMGESGTGKEVAAQTIHQLSRRRNKPFVAINCGAISPSLIESELFGHERGSFTGADKRRQGYFEMADGGTLFFDEVTEMSAELQIKLLRVLETRTFRRVGGNQELKVNVRILSSTNRNLPETIQQGKLREDFYYRLNVFPLMLPPLRDRVEDIPLLAMHFLARIEEREQGGFKEIEPDAVDLLVAHSWPGNVRELRNVIHRAYVLSNPPVIGAAAVRSILGVGGPVPMTSVASPRTITVAAGRSLEEMEAEILRTSLDAAGGDVKKAAASLKVPQKTLAARLRAHGIAVPGAARPSGKRRTRKS